MNQPKRPPLKIIGAVETERPPLNIITDTPKDEKKNLVQNVVPTTSKPLSVGSKPFQDQVDTEIPRVLTASGQELYKEQVKDYKPPVQKQPSAPKQQPLSNLESIKNTVYNVANSLKGVLPRLSLTSMDVFEKVIGKDLTGRLASLPRIEFSSDGVDIVTGRTPEQIRNESIQSLDYLGTKTKPTAGIVENARNFNIPGLAAGIVDAAGGLVSTIIPSALSGGSLLVTEMVGGGLYDYNTAKAKAKGISTEELYKRGDADFGVPAAIGGVGYAMERIGLKGFTNSISKKLAGSGFKKALLLGNEWNKEGFTEWVQVGLDEANIALANGLSIEDAVEAATDKMTSVQGLEAYAKGFAGSAAASGVGRAAKRLVSPKNKAKVSELEQQKNQAIQDLANDNIAPEAKEAILDVLENTNEQIDDLVNIDIKETDNLDDNQKVKVSEINSKIEGIDAAIENENTSESTKSILEKQKQKLESELDTIIGEVKVPQPAQPKIETREDVIKEIRAAESEMERTGDFADYKIKIDDLNARLENLVPEPEIEGESAQPTQEDVLITPETVSKPKIVVHATEGDSGFALSQFEGVDKNNIVQPEDVRAFVSDGKTKVIGEAKVDASGGTEISIAAPMEDVGGRPGGARYDITIPNNSTAKVQEIVDIIQAEHIKSRDKGDRQLIPRVTKLIKDYIDSRTPTEIIDTKQQPKPKTDAVQEQTAGQVPVLTEATAGQEVEQGKPKSKVEGVTEEGVKAEEVDAANKKLKVLGERKVQEGKGDWRKAFNDTTDPFRKADILRAIAEVSTDTNEQTDILEAAKGMPEESNIVEEIRRKQPATKEQTPAQQVEQLRAEEQAEIKAKFPNAEYKADGKIDVDKLSVIDQIKYGAIYMKYDNLISPLLPKSETKVEEVAPEKPKAEPKAKAKVSTINKFKEAIDLFYDISAADGSAKKGSLARKRQAFLAKNPTIKYIDDNWQNISKQLEAKGLIKKEGNCP